MAFGGLAPGGPRDAARAPGGPRLLGRLAVGRDGVARARDGDDLRAGDAQRTPRRGARERARIWQTRRCPVGRRGEVEGRREIAGDRPAPRAEVRDLGAEAALEEAQQRGVVEAVGADQAAAAEGRDDEQWHAEAQADRAAYALAGVGQVGHREPLALD